MTDIIVEELTRLEKIKAKAKEDLKIDEVNLDTASLNTGSIYGSWHELYIDEGRVMKRLQSREAKLYKKLWTYYQGKAPSKVYVEKPQPFTILKSDVDKFIKADDEWIKLQEIMDDQNKLVGFIEGVMKKINYRSTDIKNAIEWRKFINGAH